MLPIGATGAEVGVNTGGKVGIAFIVVAGTVIEGVADDIAVRLDGWKSSLSSRLRFREPPMSDSTLSDCGGSVYCGNPFAGMYQLGCAER